MADDLMAKKNLERILNNTSIGKIRQIESFFNFSLDDQSYTAEEKLAFIKSYTIVKKNAAAHSASKDLIHEQKQADLEVEDYKHEKSMELEAARFKALDYTLTKFLGMLAENNQSQLKQIESKFNEISEQAKGIKLLPEHASTIPSEHDDASEYVALMPTYSNCWRKHDDGHAGPEHAILTMTAKDGLHMRCLVAYAAQNPGDKGFARLKYQIFHEELLRQGDCPRPYSRSISRRIPGISWLLTKPGICPLADGKEHVIAYNT
ncbi:MAG: hypothetical protein GXP63_05375 [DPANN group archaeon]|nr:hypothetical protein [DPANN group archaeon]